MASTSIATIFLDRDLAIKRYTPSAVELFSLRASDLGRPLRELRQLLEYPDLITDAEKVLRTLGSIERQVPNDSHWFQTRLQPYRTLEDHIGGVVLTCVDVTEQRAATEMLEQDLVATTRLSVLGEQLIADVDEQSLLGAVLDAALAITRADAGTVQFFDEQARVLRIVAHRGLPKHVTDHFAEVDTTSGSPCGESLRARQRFIAHYDAGVLVDPSESNRWHREEAGLRSGQSTPLLVRTGRVLGILSTHWKKHHELTEREMRYCDLLARLAADAIERKQADDLLRGQMDELQRFNAVAVGRENRMIDLKKEVNALAVQLGEERRYPLEFEQELGT